jgi:hypothetical protein
MAGKLLFPGKENTKALTSHPFPILTLDSSQKRQKKADTPN